MIYRLSPGLHAVLVCQNSQLRDGTANQKSTLKRSLFERRFESRFAIRMGITRRWRCAAARIGLGKRRYSFSISMAVKDSRGGHRFYSPPPPPPGRLPPKPPSPLSDLPPPR